MYNLTVLMGIFLLENEVCLFLLDARIKYRVRLGIYVTALEWG